jgi:hypothetical protein
MQIDSTSFLTKTPSARQNPNPTLTYTLTTSQLPRQRLAIRPHSSSRHNAASSLSPSYPRLTRQRPPQRDFFSTSHFICGQRVQRRFLVERQHPATISAAASACSASVQRHRVAPSSSTIEQRYRAAPSLAAPSLAASPSEPRLSAAQRVAIMSSHPDTPSKSLQDIEQELHEPVYDDAELTGLCASLDSDMASLQDDMDVQVAESRKDLYKVFMAHAKFSTFHGFKLALQPRWRRRIFDST